MRKRGAHFKRRIDPHAGLQAIAMQHQLDHSQKQTIGLALRTLLEALRLGKADEHAFHNLAAAVNVSLVLCERGIGEEYLDLVKRAQDALLRLYQRGRQSGRWVMDGPGLNDLREAIDLHEQHLALVSRAEAANAMREVMRRINRGDVFEGAKA